MNLLDEVLALKHLDRAGWRRVGIDRPESVAAHTWGVCWLVLVLCPDELDRNHALQMAVIHDLAETRTGDITPHDGVSPAEKGRMESDAIAQMLRERPDLAALWQDYEAQESEEARFVHDLDRLDMALQAVRYGRELGADTDEFLDSARRDIRHPIVRAELDKLQG